MPKVIVFGSKNMDLSVDAPRVPAAGETLAGSHFMTPELFTKTIGEAARDARRRLRQVEYRTQSPDHPVLWGADQSLYLKFYIFQVVDET